MLAGAGGAQLPLAVVDLAPPFSGALLSYFRGPRTLDAARQALTHLLSGSPDELYGVLEACFQKE